MSRSAVYGILQDPSHVEGLVDSLRQEGFGSRDISLLLAPIVNVGPLFREIARSVWPVGIRALAFPGVGPLIGAGPIMNSFALKGVEDCVIGTLFRKLAGIGIAENHARRYDRRIKSGGLLLSVRCSNHLGTQRVMKLLKQTGAEEIWSNS
jgi:hypothetical protein